MIICLNGKFLDKKNAKISVLDNGFLYGDGIYETMRTYKGVILELEIHMKRLQKSAKTLGLKIIWPINKIKEWAQKTVRLNNIKTGRVRITLSRGVNGFDFKSCKNPTLSIHAEKLILNSGIYKNGVSVVTMKLERVLPEVKTVGLTHMIQAYRAMNLRKETEAIIVDKKKFVREGASTNIFIVKKNKLWTPKSGILMGTTRNRIIELAKKTGLKVIIKDFKIEALAGSEEIFLTNRPREIIPVTKLNDKAVGNGKVGEITKKMMIAYKKYVEDYVKTHILPNSKHSAKFPHGFISII